MLLEKVKDYFEKYPELKILFFFDPKEERKDEIENWADTEIIIITVNNELFHLKYQLESELADKKVFLYFPYAEPKGKERRTFTLLDLIKANRVLLIDDVEDFMEEYNLKPYQRDRVSKYIELLKNKGVQKTLSKILKADSFDDENQIKKGLICHLLGFSRIEEETIILAKLFTSLLQKNKDLFSIIDKIKELDGESYLCKLFDEYFDIEIAQLKEKDILLAIKKAKYNLILQNYADAHPNDTYSKLKITNPAKINRLNAFLNDWSKDDDLTKEIENVFNELAPDVNENMIIKNYGIDGDFGFYSNSLSFNIIQSIVELLEYQPDKSINILTQLNNSRNGNSVELKDLIEFLLRVANVFKLLNSISSYIYDKPINYLEEYVNKFESIDYNYRKAILLNTQLRTYHLPAEIQLENLLLRFNKKYEDYLKEINTQWLKCLEDHDFEFYQIPVTKQFEFYKNNIAESDQKIAVIISDGLRFESAKELLSVLHSDPKHQAEISYMLSSLPSNTRMGMSTLLPHTELQMKDEFIHINNISTEGLENREKILQAAEKDSRVVSFDKLQQMTQEESRELFKTKIVYIYHNVIDAVGDDRKTESRTFEEVERAIKELAPMIKKIHSSFNVSKIFITADHGFLYNSNELPEAMYETLPDNKNAIVNHNRFSILKKEIKTDSYIFNLSKAANTITDYKITIPKAINRYKRQGHGVHYVHGGASLQEMIVPLIESSRKREEITEKVTFKLVSKDLKVVSGAIKIKLIQGKPVSSLYKPINITCALYTASDEIVSNEIYLILDSTSDLPTERVKEIILNLNIKAGSESFFYLKIFDKQKDPNKLNPIVNEKVINQTLIQSDFE
ncbi:MAG: BREX-1 system phosphatase PglZ type A [Bacteroidetes bacterium]|nr:BREX-1 system phosphatase PglZ type A [Bacteroidota bacterium]